MNVYVVLFSTLQIFLSFVAEEEIEMHEIDVKTVFWNGDPNEDICVER